MKNIPIEKSWKKALIGEFKKPYYNKLTDFVAAEYVSTDVYPPHQYIFNAFAHCPFNAVSVVILGQDPYHGAGQAHGLSFSVPDGITFPPSLRNIYKEIIAEYGGEMPRSGNLEHWADQGVLLLNATLTVRAGQAGSHQKKGWELFTDTVIETLSREKENIVFILWGNYARAKKSLIDSSKHLILESAHPSPFSAHSGFFGNNHFKKTNEYLESKGKKGIAWIKVC